MALGIVVFADSGRTLFATVTQVSTGGTPGSQWDNTNTQFGTGISIANRTITLTEGTGADLGRYSGGVSGAMQTYTGSVAVQIHDSSASNRVVAGAIVELTSGNESRFAVQSDLTGLATTVWSTALPGSFTSGQAGKIIGDNLNATVASRATESLLLTTAADVLIVKGHTDDIGTAGAGLTAIPWNASWDAEVQSECTDALNAYDPPTNTEMVAAFTEIKGATFSASTDTLEAIRDRGDAAWVTGAAGLSAAVLADAIWDEALSGHLTAGTAGAAVSGTSTSATTAATQATNAAADALAAKTAAQSVDTKLSSARAGYLDNLSAGAVATAAGLTLLQNSPRIRIIGPATALIPDSGNNVYEIDLFCYDSVGNMEGPDSTPTLAAANQTGADRSANLSAVTVVGTGRFRATYTVPAAHLTEHIIITATVVEGAVNLFDAHTFTVASVAASTGVNGDFTGSDRTKLDGIFAKLPSTAFITGTAAADGAVDLDAADGDRGQFKADVSALATAASITSLPADVRALLNSSPVPASNMRGTDNAMLAASYTAPNNAGIAAAASDASAAKTAALAAQTSAASAATAASSVDTKLTTQRATNLDNLNATVSSRSTFDHTTNDVTLAPGHGLALDADLAAVRERTDNLPDNPADSSDVPTAAQVATQVNTTLGAAHGTGIWDAGGDATLAKQNEILAAIGAVNPAPPSPVAQVSDRLTWTLPEEDGVSPEIVTLAPGSTAVLAMDFASQLNPGTGIATVNSVTDTSGNDLEPEDLLPSQDRLKAHFEVTVPSAARHVLVVQITTSDGNTLVGQGVLVVE